MLVRLRSPILAMFHPLTPLLSLGLALLAFTAPATSTQAEADVTLTGTVLGHDGTPRTAARIVVDMSSHSSGADWNKTVTGLTDDQGHFEFVIRGTR